MPIKAYDWLRYHRKRSPKKLAAIELHGDKRFTYEEFDQRVSRLAMALKETLNVDRGDRVAILAPNTIHVFELQFACVKLGAIMVPVNWRLAVPELEYILNDCAPKALIYDLEFADEAEALKEYCAIEFAIALDGESSDSEYEYLIAKASGEADAVDATHDDLMTIMYTSGTTGHPKGAMITNGMTFWNAINLGMLTDLSQHAVHLGILPTFHTGGLNCYANPVFHAGGTVAYMRNFDPGQCLRLLADPEYGFSHFFGVPANYLFISQHPEFEETELSHLKMCGVGGAPCAVTILETYGRKGVQLSQGFGMTETSPTVMALDPADGVRKQGSVGIPVLHNEACLVDEHGREIETPDTVGELWCKGPNITPGYWNNPEATAESITDGWLHTGDAARFDEDGFFYIVDRWKDMFISGGENVYPAEVESVLFQLDGVADAAVVGLPDDRWGEVGCAIVVAETGKELSEADVLRHFDGRLARYKIPKHARFIDELPRNATGKVLKRVLREQFTV
jgi:fatty-acyl-CoA synthase